MTNCEYSVTIYVANKKWRTLNNVRSNGNFRALKIYLKRSGIMNATINYYYKGNFTKQEKYVGS